VLFTPSQLRVKSLSWTEKPNSRPRRSASVVTTLWEDDRLEQRTYQVTGSEGEIVTVDLETRRRATDRGVARHLHARRRRSGETPPLAGGRVSRCSTGRSRTMTAPWTRFRSPSTRPGTVSLTVEPTTTEKLGFEMTSYRSSVLDGFGVGAVREHRSGDAMTGTADWLLWGSPHSLFSCRSRTPAGSSSAPRSPSCCSAVGTGFPSSATTSKPTVRRRQAKAQRKLRDTMRRNDDERNR